MKTIQKKRTSKKANIDHRVKENKKKQYHTAKPGPSVSIIPTIKMG